jgi:signal transduction histidine kinase
MIKAVRRHLGIKLFLSYLVVILVGMFVLAVTTRLIVPTAFNIHLSHMGHLATGTGSSDTTLFNDFSNAVDYAISLAALAAFATALIVSGFFARQVVQPVREMVGATQKIAEGDYRSRVRVPARQEPEDMDELAQLALRFNQMAYRLDQIETMRRRLIGDVAHELRTPLTTIKGYMEGMMDGVVPADEETYMRVHQEADRLQRLVMDLQELSQVEANAVQFNFKPTSIADLIRATQERLQRQYDDKNVKLVIDIPATLPKVEVDADRIQQVLTNLIGNALQYTSEGGQVTVQTKVSGNEVVVSIRDNGIGISAEHLPHIFDRFYRVDKSRSRVGGGSGIGLTIAKHLIEAHGGKIWVESAGIHNGSTFYFTLPVQSLQKL